MFTLVDLPEEILIKIFRDLDQPSQYNLYHTCNRTRNIICTFGLVKKCNMSFSILSSGHILNTDFMKNISYSIQELNLSAAANLTKTLLVPAARRLKNLHTIDVGYTNITIFDFLDVYQNCPTIKNVTINFIFHKNISPQLPSSMMIRCQEMFKDFKSVHFIGSQTNLIYSHIAAFLLSKAKDLHLQYTVLHDSKISYSNITSGTMNISFDKFYVYFSFISWRYAFTNFLVGSPFLSEDNLESCECIFILKPSPLTTDYFEIFCSPLFVDFFGKHFNIEARSLREYKRSTVHNAFFLFWKKSKTVFDDKFFKHLLVSLRPYIPYCFQASNDEPVPMNYDWYQIACIGPPDPSDPNSGVQPSSNHQPSFKKARIGQQNILLDYDKAFKNKDELELSIFFLGPKINPRTISPSFNYLTKLTFLNMKGNVQYSGEFFNILFRCCNKLETFDIETATSSHVKSIGRSIPLSKSIKNLRLVTKDMDFKFMVSTLSQCGNLENVHLIDISHNTYEMVDPLVMFQKCAFLYCFHTYAPISDNKKRIQMQIFNKARLKSQKPHISATMLNAEHYDLDNSPFIEVFKLTLTKPFPM